MPDVAGDAIRPAMQLAIDDQGSADASAHLRQEFAAIGAMRESERAGGDFALLYHAASDQRLCISSSPGKQL